MEEKDGDAKGYRVHTISLRVRNEDRYAYEHCGAFKEALCTIR